MGIDRPVFGSISRINLVMISEYAINPREGTSPGIIAGFFIGTPQVLGFLLFTGFLSASLWFFTPILAAIPGQLSILGYYVFCRLVLVWVYSSPLDLLQIRDESFIVLLALIAFRWRILPIKKSAPERRNRFPINSREN
jgi:hypothetical protein